MNTTLQWSLLKYVLEMRHAAESPLGNSARLVHYHCCIRMGGVSVAATFDDYGSYIVTPEHMNTSRGSASRYMCVKAEPTYLLELNW